MRARDAARDGPMPPVAPPFPFPLARPPTQSPPPRLTPSKLHKLYSTQVGAGYAYPFLNTLVLAVCKRLTRLCAHAAALSPHPIRHPQSARQIKDATRQALEKSLHVSASSLEAGELNDPESVGDILWQLASLLWRHYAWVRGGWVAMEQGSRTL